ncbi:MAG: outer membrane protein assembly factor BamE, partial [Planctomycetota bacterium]|nr:outer membrane protein assembly factor BamE [Planctomycetota bacterium]
ASTEAPSFFESSYPRGMLRHLLPSTGQIALLAALVLPGGGCRSVSQPGFDAVRPGQTRAEVRELMGRPSSTFERVTAADGSIIRLERWQYGDNASSMATGLVYPDLPSESVWAVFFDEDGRVVRVQAADLGAEARGREQLRRMQDPVQPGVPSRSR